MLVRKWKLWLFGTIVVALICTYINNTYFFNPLTFHQDLVTYSPWSSYKNPVDVEYLEMDGVSKEYISNDKQEADFIVSELKKGSLITGAALPDNHPLGDKTITITIRHLQDGVNSPGDILLVAQGYEGSDIIRTGQKMEPIKVTEGLKNLITKRIGQAKVIRP